MDGRESRDNLTDSEIKELLEEIKKLHFTDSSEQNKQVDLDNALGCTIKEFLTSFVLIGYDMQGDAVILRSEENQMSRDALRSLVLKYLQLMLYEE